VYVQLPDGQQVSRLLEEGDFGFVPAGLLHAYRVEQAGHMMGVASGGFERFFQQMGTPADTIDPDSPPFVPDFPPDARGRRGAPDAVPARLHLA
jgi:quercetin 2,3-dioxygenase